MKNIKITVLIILCLFGLNVMAGNKNQDPNNDRIEKDKKVLLEGQDDLLFNPNRARVAYEGNQVETASCNLNIRFNLKVKGLTVEFVNKSKGSYTDVEWKFGDGILSHDKESTSHTYEKGGIYYFSILLFNEQTSCTDFFSGKYFLFEPLVTDMPEPKHDIDNVRNIAGKSLIKQTKATANLGMDKAETMETVVEDVKEWETLLDEEEQWTLMNEEMELVEKQCNKDKDKQYENDSLSCCAK